MGYRERCFAKPLDREVIEKGVKDKIRTFFFKPEVYLNEMEGRLGIHEQTKEDIEKQIKNLEKEYRGTIDDECKYADLLSPEAFKEKKNLLILRRQYLVSEKENQVAKLVNLNYVSCNHVDSSK
jgi:hypothetical protein